MQQKPIVCTKLTTESKTSIGEAFWHLLSHDEDRARLDNDVGYNKPDSVHLHTVFEGCASVDDIVSMPDDVISAESHRLLKYYKNQLSVAGFTEDELRPKFKEEG